MKSLLTLAAFYLLFLNIQAQDKEFEQKILDETDAKKFIKRIDVEQHDYWLVIVADKKVGMHAIYAGLDYNQAGEDSLYVESSERVLPMEYDKIKDFSDFEDINLDRFYYDLYSNRVAVAEVMKKDQVGLLVRHGEPYNEFGYIQPEEFFHEIKWENHTGSLVPVRVGNQWGIFDYINQEYVFKCKYESLDGLPQSTDPNGFTPYSLSIFKDFNKKYKSTPIDLIDLDGGNGDGLFKARNGTTKKWGLYQYMGDEFVEAIPMHYDSLYHFSWNGYVTAVFNNGKVGFYLSYWSYDEAAKESVPCMYDDYKRYEADDRILRMAVKRDGKWGWVDWLTGKEKSEFTYNSPDDLPYPHYKQETELWEDEDE